jgi:uncharacterized membrane protein
MVLMALDHSRNFTIGHEPDPTNLATTTVALFFTRWVTHYCAPVFVFLAGTAAWLARGKRGPTELARFLSTRGLFLVVLEPTLVRLGMVGDVSYHLVILQVIWVIGWCMIALAALQFAGPMITGAIGLALVFGHNLLDPIHGGWTWHLLHQSGPMQLGPTRVIVGYPFLPWFGLICSGFALGPLFTDADAQRRKKWLYALGAAAIVLFVILRATNLYGDPQLFASQPRGAVYTALSFINTTKYPPSLQYALMTLGPALIALALFDGRRAPEWLLVFGRVPLFYYVWHLFVLRLTAFATKPILSGLPWTYAAWILAVIILYFPCRWYMRYKAAHPGNAWLSYL